MKFGAYVFQQLAKFEAGAGTAEHVLKFFDSRDPWFNLRWANGLGTRVPLATPEFWDDQYGTINSEAFGSKILQEANRAKAYGKLLVLRPFHEWNGDWYPWFVRVGEEQAFKSAWQRIVAGFRNAGAANARFLFAPNVDSSPNSASLADAFPGPEWVDLIGADGYSWQNSYRDFSTCFGATYEELCALHPTAPFWVGETACGYQTGRQAEYAASIFSAQFPRLEAVTWFAVDKEEDWYPRADTFAAIRAGRGL